jgi:hypothetical protein
MKKVTELYDTEFGGIPPELQPIPPEYGIDRSKKTDGIPCRRNSVDTLAQA